MKTLIIILILTFCLTYSIAQDKKLSKEQLKEIQCNARITDRDVTIALQNEEIEMLKEQLKK